MTLNDILSKVGDDEYVEVHYYGLSSCKTRAVTITELTDSDVIYKYVKAIAATTVDDTPVLCIEIE